METNHTTQIVDFLANRTADLMLAEGLDIHTATERSIDEMRSATDKMLGWCSDRDALDYLSLRAWKACRA
jgi:hypothetical protein